ncbi:glycoside hydrolase family 3 N-terminal domain-containing protein [Rhodococcus sp. IEGM 1409]|uniref:glycoside hydrolase family 3 N-terminal domain-containing protein n=1 Tax=Rhodococcus sp. IEGM 1409 TaxID=3047082 RepID=UPI0024B7C1FF|nr:glycoside hydrolase family 3 N-terminal domain-containing protein [Rhodococcus sp. IEGM 1409]MDI9901569.1 glycoside hydrolase family 3 N-terminal domain-containing protein [Rhodococcus sp. IEGM 1409]
MSNHSAFERDAHAVMFPAFDAVHVDSWLADLLRAGTVAVILGESREEYVARRMTPARRERETSRSLRGLTSALEASTDTPLLVAVDQEPWGIQRLHALVPQFPAADALTKMTDTDIENVARSVASAAREMGVNAFLSPVLDRLEGNNPWLFERTLDLPPSEIARIAAAFVHGVQTTGVAAIAKHFPGFPALEHDPAVKDTAVAAKDWSAETLTPFRAVVNAGVSGMMVGPAIVEAVDPTAPATTSSITVRALRQDLGFRGVVVSDDLDSPATTRGRSLEETALASLLAGSDLLLIPGGDEVTTVAQSLAAEAVRNPIAAERLRNAANRVRALVNATDLGTIQGKQKRG